MVRHGSTKWHLGRLPPRIDFTEIPPPATRTRCHFCFLGMIHRAGPSSVVRGRYGVTNVEMWMVQSSDVVLLPMDRSHSVSVIHPISMAPEFPLRCTAIWVLRLGQLVVSMD